MNSVLFILISSIFGCILSVDIPCAARWQEESQGYVCVCNSTYCDTVESPAELPATSFYHYKTSNSSPGFSKTVHSFTNSPLSTFNETTFKVNASAQYQEVLGFGGSVTDTTCSVVLSLPPDAQQKFIESYFGSEGIEYSMLRIPIGSTDFSSRVYTLDDTLYDNNLQHFNLSEEDYNLRIPLIKKALAASKKDIKLLACTWAAPSWMKGNTSQYPGYISKEYQHAWAKYHIRFLEEYQRENLTVWSLSGGNEVMLLYILTTELVALNSTLQWAHAQREWLRHHLKPLLVASDFSQVKFLTLEDQKIFAPYWMDRFRIDPEAYRALDGLALHWYWDRYLPNSLLDNLHSDNPEKLILSTEASINDGIYGSGAVVLGSWARAERYLYNLFQVLDHWTNAFLDWNLALDENGGPSMTYSIDSAVIVNTSSGEFYKQPMFYALGHFSKFVQPGSRKVNVTTVIKEENTKSEPNYKDIRRGLFSVTKVLQTQDLEVQYDTDSVPSLLECLAFTNPDGRFAVIVINTENQTLRVNVEDERVGVISVDIERHSVNTFLYWP